MTTPEELLAHEITIMRDVIRIDVQTSTPGVEFSEAWERREVGRIENQEFFMLSKADLIASKRASGRVQDLEDVRWLELPENEHG